MFVFLPETSYESKCTLLSKNMISATDHENCNLAFLIYIVYSSQQFYRPDLLLVVELCKVVNYLVL